MNSATDAVALALRLVGHGVYVLGTGDCDTPDDDPTDCAGFALCKCLGLRRHRPGYNSGPWATVADDINSNSAIEDAIHRRELFAPVIDLPQPGDLLAYPTIRIKDAHGTLHTFVGHVAIVVGVDRLTSGWDWLEPDWAQLDIVQAAGPNGKTPGITSGTGAHFCDHDRVWPKPEHRSWLIRAASLARSTRSDQCG